MPACLVLLLWEILSRGDTLQTPQLAEPCQHPARERAGAEAAPVLGPARPQPGWGGSSACGAASSSPPPLVPPAAIWKYLSPCFGAKE